jgi:hypothetical protein
MSSRNTETESEYVNESQMQKLRHCRSKWLGQLNRVLLPLLSIGEAPAFTDTVPAVAIVLGIKRYLNNNSDEASDGHMLNTEVIRSVVAVSPSGRALRGLPDRKMEIISLTNRKFTAWRYCGECQKPRLF